MKATRRQVLLSAVCGAGLGLPIHHQFGKLFLTGKVGPNPFDFQESRDPVSHSITPVLFDGKWNWKTQPEDQQGYLDPREFDLEIGLRWKSQGNARNVQGSTPVPVNLPGQEISDLKIEASDRCSAIIAPLTANAAQLQVHAAALAPRETVEAVVRCKVKLFRFCPKYTADQFPDRQDLPDEIRKEGLGNSPGIRADLKELRDIVETETSRHDHPWSKAEKFFRWTIGHIAGEPMAYTSVEKALKFRKGDCEERAGVFVALCRAAGIPARLVLVPNHCWAEFCLLDKDSLPHWIPAHTAAYDWFGWTGAHELVLQKGDRIWQPGSDKTVRLVTDWYSGEGRKPEVEYFASLIPAEGPGKRKKNELGGWDLVCDHPDAQLVRH